MDDPASILAGWKLTYTVHAALDAAALVGTVLSNTATASAADAVASDTDENTLVAAASLTAAKDALNSLGASARALPFVDADDSGCVARRYAYIRSR